MDIKQAIALAKQGRNVEAQDILADLIHANPHDITAWFWYVETLDTTEERVKVLNSCLQDNPENPQVIKALDMLKVKLPQQSKVPEPYSHENSFGTMPYETEQQKTSLPHIEIPENAAVLAYLHNPQTNNPLIAPYENTLTPNSSPGSVDIIQAFEKDMSRFPQNATYLVYGNPILLNPRTNIIFYAVVVASASRYYRLPRKNIQEMLSKKVIKEHQIHEEIGKEWVSLYDQKESFTQKLYTFYGNTTGRAGIFQVNYKEDFFKQPSEFLAILSRLVNTVLVILLIIGLFLLMLYIKGPNSSLLEYLKGLF